MKVKGEVWRRVVMERWEEREGASIHRRSLYSSALSRQSCMTLSSIIRSTFLAHLPSLGGRACKIFQNRLRAASKSQPSLQRWHIGVSLALCLSHASSACKSLENETMLSFMLALDGRDARLAGMLFTIRNVSTNLKVWSRVVGSRGDDEIKTL